MSWEIYALVLLGALTLLLVSGQWTAFALGSTGLLLIYLSRGLGAFPGVASVVWNNSSYYLLVAVPLFLLMGELILRAGISHLFYRGVSMLLRFLPGGLLHTNVLACAIFSAICGSSVATAASVGTVAIPEMQKRGYQSQLIMGSLAAGGTLGILIPPSIIMILYGALVEESVPKLFLAGVFPGLGLALLFSVYIAFRLLRNPALAPTTAELRLPLREQFAHVAHLIPIVLLMVVVLGGIYSGVTTPTEAAGIGALGALLLALAYRNLNLTTFMDCVLSAVRTTCMVMFIIIGAQVLVLGLTYSGLSRELSGFIVGLGFSKWPLFAAIVVLYIIMGCFVDGLSMIYITLPVLYPVIIAAGFDLLWFGVIVTILIELGQITPPVGVNLFTIQAISGGRPFSDVALGALPFAVIMLVMIVLLAFFPAIALWLPSLL
jgi:tripartite ATP-independent transporter DctM subunit